MVRLGDEISQLASRYFARGRPQDMKTYYTTMDSLLEFLRGGEARSWYAAPYVI